VVTLQKAGLLQFFGLEFYSVQDVFSEILAFCDYEASVKQQSLEALDLVVLEAFSNT
jgi:hypothetical protein